MSTKIKLRTWRFFSPLLIALLLISPLVSSAEFAGNFPVTNNGNTLIPANATAALVMQFDLPAPAVDPYILNGAGYIVADGDALSAFSVNNYYSDEDHSNDNGNYSGAEVIVESANTFIQASEIITPGTADLKGNWNVGQNIYFGDEDHDGGADYDGNGVGEIIVNDNLTDGIISGAEVISAGVADLQSFPASYYYLETDGDNTFDDGEDIVKLAHNAAIDTGNGDQIELFGANDYYSDANSNTLYTDGEAIVSSADANLDNSDTVVTAGSLKNVASTFCGPAPTGPCTYYDPAPAGIPYCVVDDADVSWTITVGDKLVSDTCGTGHGDNYTFVALDAELGTGLSGIPATHRFIDDNTNGEHDSTELVWTDDGDLVLEAGELLFGFSTTALTSLSGSLIHVFNDSPSNNNFYDDGEEIFTIYYAGAANDIASGDTINAMPAEMKFSDNNNDGDYTVTGVTGNTELIAQSADLTLAGAEIRTPGYVDVTHMWVNAQMKYSDVNGNSLYNDGELIADSADNILAGGEIVKDGYIDLIDFASWLMYHDGSGDGNYTDGEDIIVDVDDTDYYNADQLTSLKIGNPGTCLNTALNALDIWEDTDGSNTLTGPDNNLGGVTGLAPYFGRDFPTSGSMYTATSNERTIFITIDSAAADGSTVCTVTPIIPNTGGAPYAAQFLSGDNGPTDGNVATTDTTTIDLIAPTPNVADMDTYVVEHAGSGTVANTGDDIVLVWDSSSYGDVVSASADFSDFGGGVVAMEDDGAGGNCDDIAAGDDIWCGTYLLVAGNIDDTDNDVTVTLATDAAGNVGADTTDDEQISVDNEAPVVTVGNISVTGDSGTAGAFKAGDTPVPTWDNSALGDNNSDIFSVTVDGSAFRAADAAMPAVDDGTFCDSAGAAGDGIWCATFTGLLDSQDDINNNVSLTVVDDGGNSTTVAGTNNYTVDNQLPAFTAVNAVEALLQTGAAPTLSTNLWYYYTGQNLRLQLNTGAETDGNDLAVIKACMRSMNEHSPTQTCALGDFANPANYQLMSINAGADSAELNYNLAGLPSGWPTQVDGFQMNFELTDDAGNIWSSAAANQYYIAVFNVIPQDIVASLNNATTTDWSTITDFTNVPAGTIVFNSQVLGTDVARMTFNAAMDLTSLATVTGLQALAANVTTTDSILRLDSSALAAFDIATQLMVKPAGGLQPEFSVKDDAGAVIGTIPSTAGALDSYDFAGHGTASNFVWAAGPGTLTFDVTGFSSYESDVTAPTATIVPANSSSSVAVGANVVVTFDEAINTGTFTYTLAPNPGGLAVVWSGGNTVATISHTAFANNTSYTFSITGGDDLSGNSIAPTASTFTTVALSGGGGGGGGSAAFGAPACSGTACTSTTTDTTQDMAEEDGTGTDGTGTTTGGQFTDMTNHWAASFVEIAQSLGYIEGYEDDTFRPDQEINRAEAAKLIAMWMNPSLYECTESYFTDVSCTEWFGKYVQYLRRMAVIEGYTDGTFRPDAVITRAEALKMMLYAKGMIHPDASGVENIFSDVFSEDWFYAPVLKGYSMGIVGGYADGTFGPNKPITRAEFTKIFVSTLIAEG